VLKDSGCKFRTDKDIPFVYIGTRMDECVYIYPCDVARMAAKKKGVRI